MCNCLQRRAMLIALLLAPIRAFSRPPPGSDPTSFRAQWFAKQRNSRGGSCCELGDGHELDPGDVRFDPETGLYSVRLPDPTELTFGRSLNEGYTKPKQWVEVPDYVRRDPDGGTPPVTNPIIWFNTGSIMGTESSYRIYCFEPNTLF